MSEPSSSEREHWNIKRWEKIKANANFLELDVDCFSQRDGYAITWRHAERTDLQPRTINLFSLDAIEAWLDGVRWHQSLMRDLGVDMTTAVERAADTHTQKRVLRELSRD